VVKEDEEPSSMSSAIRAGERASPSGRMTSIEMLRRPPGSLVELARRAPMSAPGTACQSVTGKSSCPGSGWSSTRVEKIASATAASMFEPKEEGSKSA
jgi:hypothetical protein